MRVRQFVFAKEVTWPALQGLQLRRGPTQGASYINHIPGPSAGPEESLPSCDTSQQNDIRNYRPRFRHVSASQWQLMTLSQRHESLEKTIHPRSGKLRRKSQRKKRCLGTGAH